MSDPSTAPYAPSRWDALMNTEFDLNTVEEALKGAPSGLRARRQVFLAMKKPSARAIDEALAALDRVDDTPVRGMRMLAFASLGQYSHVLSLKDAPITKMDEYQIEDACDAAFARAMALVEESEFEEGRAQLYLAERLAQMLGMRHRVQHVRMELARLNMCAGRPMPAMLIEAMALEPLTVKRRAWGIRILAEAQIALGDYRSAATEVAGGKDVGCDMSDWIAALVGHSEQRPAGCAQGEYREVARALWALRLDQSLTAPASTGNSIQAQYAALLRAWAMLRTRSMSGQARNLLLDFVARTPDHRAHRAAALIQANASNPSLGDDIDALVAEFNAALRGMVRPDEFLALLRAISPEAAVLLGVLPGIHSAAAEAMPEVAILTGQSLAYQFVTHKLPGKTTGSLIMVQSAALGRTGPEARPHPQALQRVRAALADLGVDAYVNLGVTIRSVAAFRDAARASRRGRWDAALERALSWVDSTALQVELRRHLDL